MSVYKRGQTYWKYKFLFQGQLIRASLPRPTPRRSRGRLRAGAASRSCPEDSHQQNPATRTAAAVCHRCRRLAQHKAGTEPLHHASLPPVHSKPIWTTSGRGCLFDIRVEDISALQHLRQTEGKSPRTVNAEVGVLRQILKHRNLWASVSDRVRFLREKRDVGRSIDRDDEFKLLQAIVQRRSPSLLPLFVVSIDSGLRASELRHLHRNDLRLVWTDGMIQSGEITVSRSKTEGGVGRVVPFTRRACAVLTSWLSRFPGASPDSYLFPRHQVGFAGYRREPHLYNVDLTRPINEWKSAWNLARKAAGVNYRWHDLRHTFISRLAENPNVSEQTITALAGHVSKRMLEHYSHIRTQAKRDAISTLDSMNERAQNWAQWSDGGAVAFTKDTEKSLDLVENFMERVIGFEPTTLCLASTRSTN